jgi:hypothetical protein
MLGAFLQFLDISISNVALPHMQRSSVPESAALIATSAIDSVAAPKSIANVASVDYFRIPGGTFAENEDEIRVVNQSGSQLCALYYVFDANQELSECCGCEISNAGETDTSLLDLISDPANGIFAFDGSILLVSSVGPDPNDTDLKDSSFGPTACDPAAPHPAPQLEAWSTHTLSSGEVTEGEFTPITLSTSNLSNAASLCGFIELNQSGPGICGCSEEG